MALSMLQMNVSSESLKCKINDYEFDISMYSTEYDETLGLMRVALVAIDPKVPNLMSQVMSAVSSKNKSTIVISNTDLELVEANDCSVEYMNMSKDKNTSFSATFLYEKV